MTAPSTPPAGASNTPKKKQNPHVGNEQNSATNSPDTSQPQSPFAPAQPVSQKAATAPEDPFQVFNSQQKPATAPQSSGPENKPPAESGDPSTPTPNSTANPGPGKEAAPQKSPSPQEGATPTPPNTPFQSAPSKETKQANAQDPFAMFDQNEPTSANAGKERKKGEQKGRASDQTGNNNDQSAVNSARDSKAGQAAEALAKEKIPYADKLDDAKHIKDKLADEGLGAAAEETAAVGGEIGAQVAADALTGGATASLDNDHIVNRAIRKVGRLAGVAAVKQWIVVNKILFMSILIIAGGASVGLIGTFTDIGRRTDVPPPPTEEQCATMPEGWCDVVYQAQKVTETETVAVPWTILAGIVRNTTDFGRYSPYDHEDRYPDRPIPPYIEEHFSDVSYGTDGVGGIQEYKTGPLAWGGHSNGRIPESELKPIPWAPNWKLEAAALDALVLLNEAYKADHGGRSLGITSAYRPYKRQQELYRRYCSGGAKPCRAANPGTSNHGWGKAIDFANFGGMGDFSRPNYKWMVQNGPRFGWHHPPSMGPGGNGPKEPWHWEFRGVRAADTNATATASNTPVLPGDFADGTDDIPAIPSPYLPTHFDFKTRTHCEVQASSLPIGGDGQEAAGPFLIKTSAANRAGLHSTEFAQDPCKAANFAALTLAELAADLEDQGLEGRNEGGGDGEEAREFWQTVISTSDIFASPDQDSECAAITSITRDLTETETDLSTEDVGKLIDQIWRCRLVNAPELHVVSELGVTTDKDGKRQIEYKTYDRAAAEATLLAEARSVAWNFSKYNAEKCSSSGTPAGERGIFPVPVTAFTHPAQACDPITNINVAAQLVIAQESIPPRDREMPNDIIGPYGPMMGGWLKLPVALGEETVRFANIGPPSAPNYPAECTASLSDYLNTKIRDTSVFKDLADLDSAPKDKKRYESAITLFPASVKKACPNINNSALAVQAASILDGYVNADTGVVPNRPEGETLADDPSEVLPGDLEPDHYEEVIDESANTETSTTEPARPETSTTEPEPDTTTQTNDEMRAVQGLANWLTWKRVDLLAQEKTTLKNPSLIDRLTTQYNSTIEPAPYYAPAVSRSETGWITESLDWAVFYGGIARSWDTHGERTGTLTTSLIRGDSAAVPAGSSEKIKTLLEIAHKQIGTAYVWGAGGKDGPTMHTVNGVKVPAFDCSGFTEYVYYQVGYEIGAWTGAQKNSGTTVKSLKDARPGDLLFFGSPNISHVAIYVEENKMIHARRAGKPVAVTNIYETPVLIKRIIEDTGSTGNVDTWIAEALNVLYANGFKKHPNDVANLKLIIQAESSGNPDAVNDWDSNARRGDPSFGLMQTIGATFDAYSLPGYKDKSHPVHQIIAGARYAERRYGSLEKVPGVVAVKAGKPYVGY